jgi:outer membrane protein assembly factor BamB
MITCRAQDADGDSLVYTWDAEAGQISGSDTAVTWTSPNQGGIYSVWVTVDDGRGKTASDTVGVEVMGGTLLVQTSEGVIAITLDGEKHLFNESTSEVEVLGTRIFLGPAPNIQEVDHEGALVSTIDKPFWFPYGTTFVVLPDAGFAFVDNLLDSVYFMDAEGEFVVTRSVPHPSPSSLQGTRGMTVGNKLYIVDSSPDWVYEYDLDTHEGSVFEEFPGLELVTFDIDYSDGRFFIVGSLEMYVFTEGGTATELCTLPAANVVAVAVVGSYAHTVTNFTGELHRINIHTGEYTVLAEGLNYPQDIEFIPVELPFAR